VTVRPCLESLLPLSAFEIGYRAGLLVQLLPNRVDTDVDYICRFVNQPSFDCPLDDTLLLGF
jgi:hypothetical protein